MNKFSEKKYRVYRMYNTLLQKLITGREVATMGLVWFKGEYKVNTHRL